jgi:hypothetical protein
MIGPVFEVNMKEKLLEHADKGYLKYNGYVFSKEEMNSINGFIFNNRRGIFEARRYDSGSPDRFLEMCKFTLNFISPYLGKTQVDWGKLRLEYGYKLGEIFGPQSYWGNYDRIEEEITFISQQIPNYKVRAEQAKTPKEKEIRTKQYLNKNYDLRALKDKLEAKKSKWGYIK